MGESCAHPLHRAPLPLAQLHRLLDAVPVVLVALVVRSVVGRLGHGCCEHIARANQSALGGAWWRANGGGRGASTRAAAKHAERESAGCSQARARCQLQAWQAGASLGVKQSAAHAMGTERPDRLFDATEQTSANQAHR